MKYFLILFAGVLFSLPFSVTTPLRAAVDFTLEQKLVDQTHLCQWISGYYRRDGTWVRGHWRGCKGHY